MAASSTWALSSSVTLCVALACSSAERDRGSESTAGSAELAEAKSPAEPPSFEQRAPRVGDAAPPISLDSLDGARVTLPMSAADRAAILIFGSFS